MNYVPFINLSVNEFVNRDDSLGLIHQEPEPKEWLFYESKHDMQKYDPIADREGVDNSLELLSRRATI